MKTTCITLRKEDPAANMRRQLSVSVERDLFGAAVVVCRWGRIGKAGQRREHVCTSTTEARTLAARLVRKRRGRGYRSEKMVRLSNDAGRANEAASAGVRPPLGRGRAKSRPGPKRGIVAPGQMKLWSTRASAEASATTKTSIAPREPANRASGVEQVRQEKIGRLLRGVTERVTAQGESLKVQRPSEILKSDAVNPFEMRELLIEQAIGVPRRGWWARPRRFSGRKAILV